VKFQNSSIKCKTAHVYVYVYVPEERSRRNKKNSSVLLDSGVRRNDESAIKNEPNDLNIISFKVSRYGYA